MSEVQLPKGMTLGEIARRREELDLFALLGDTKVLVFRAQGEETPLYATPDTGIAPSVTAAETSAFTWSEEHDPGDLGAAVVVPLTPTHKTLFEDKLLLGRAVTNDIRLVSPQVSKEHLRFELDDTRWQVVDLGSSNGTRLGGLKLEPHRAYYLRPGDELVIGDMVVHFLDAEGLLDLTSLIPG